METRITGGSPAARIWIDRQKEENGILFFDVNMLPEREESPEPFCVSFKTPDTDVYWAIVTCYTDSVVDCRDYSHVIALNATRHPSLILKGAEGRAYQVLDCMGNETEQGRIGASLCEVSVPMAGMIQIEW